MPLFWIYKPNLIIPSLHIYCTVASVPFDRENRKPRCVLAHLPACVKLRVTAFSIRTFFRPLVALFVPTCNGSAEPIFVGVVNHICTGKINLFPHIFQWI